MAQDKNSPSNSYTRTQKYSEKYWKDEIRRAKDGHKDFWEQAEESNKLYSKRHQLYQVKRELGIWWYLVETLTPVFCSRIPKVEVDLRKKSGSIIDTTAAQALESATQYGVDSYFRFQDTAVNLAKSLLLTGRAVSEVRYEPRMKEKAFKFLVTQDPKSGQFIGPDGQPIDEDTVEIDNSNPNQLIATEIIPSKEDERFIIEPVYYKDYLVSPARNENEIEWRSRRAYLDYDQVRSKFGSKTADSISYDIIPEDVRKDSKYSSYTATLEGKSEWEEIWCEASGKCYWLNSHGNDSVFEEGEPPLNFSTFYPFSVCNANLDLSSMIPISDYWHARDTILEVERLTTRIHGLVESIKANGVYDAAIGEDLYSVLKGDFVLRPIKKWPNYKTRGGMQNMIEMFPIDAYVNALQVAYDARERAKQELFEIMKCGDIVRGVTDAQETATAQELKSGWSTYGMQVRQSQFTEFVSDSITKAAEVVANEFDPMHIYNMCDGDTIMNTLHGNQQLQGVTWDIVCQKMREGVNDYRIKVASDSLVAQNEAQERKERTDYMSSAGGFLEQSLPMVEKYPGVFPYVAKMMEFVNRTYKAGKELEGTFDGMIESVMMQIQQEKQQQAQQPQDPAIVKSQTDLQIAQLKSQTEQAQLAHDTQQDQAAAALEEFKVQSEVEMNKQQMILQAQKNQIELAINMAKLQLEQQIAQVSVDGEAAKHAHQQNVDAAQTALDVQQQKLKELQVKIEAYETTLEERRLEQAELGKVSEDAKNGPAI